MYKLVVDSSTKVLYVGLCNDSVLIEEKYISGRNDHAKNILTAIDTILKNANIKITDLDSIICGIGPGSYTGVRMAVTVGKMVATNSSVKLYGISTLFLMSSGYNGKVASYIDARRGNSFCVAYNDNVAECEEALRPTDLFLTEHIDYKAVCEDDIKVSIKKVIENAKLCENPHGFEPNYLRETEAERNLHHD